MKIKDIVTESLIDNSSSIPTELALVIYKIKNNKKIPVAKFKDIKQAYQMLDDIKNEFPEDEYKLEWIQKYPKTLYEQDSEAIKKGKKNWDEIKRAVEFRGPDSDPLHNARLNFDGIIIPLSKRNGDLLRLYRWAKNHLGNNEQLKVFTRFSNLMQLDNLVNSIRPVKSKNVDEAKRKKKRKVSRKLPRVYGGWFGFGLEGGEGGGEIEEAKLDKKTLTPEELSKLHNISVEDIKKQLFKGMKVELEHTTDKKVAMEIALDHLKEDPKYYDKLSKAELEENKNYYWKQPSKIFKNFDEEFHHIMNIKDLKVKLELLEMLAARDILKEDVKKINDNIKRTVNSLVNKFSSKNIKIGNNYIPVQVGIYQGNIMFFDIENNYPPTKNASFGKLIDTTNDQYKIDINGNTYTYPFTTFKTYTGAAVLLIDSIKKYNELRMVVNLQFDKNIPPLDNDVITENEGEVWMVAFTPRKDIEKYSKMYRQTVRYFYNNEENAFQAATILDKEGHDVYTPVKVSKRNMTPIDRVRDEIKEEEQKDLSQKTQIAGTIGTYKKAKDILSQWNKDENILDYGAGLGLGSNLLNSDSFEPNPRTGFNPTYSDTNTIPSNSYTSVVSFNVLNVVPKDVRDNIVKEIGRILKPEGIALITTRGKDVLTIKGEDGPEPMSKVSKIGTYQKGFTTPELISYVKSILGDDFEVARLNLGPAGVVVLKKSKTK